jgi:tetratricopeptide (TPR) repeat protein
MALSKHQLGVALEEAEQALGLSINDVDALKAKAKALIFSGQYAEGRKLSNQIIRLDPAVLAEPLYIIGLSHFASGSYDKAADYAEQAMENDPTTRAYALLLAAAYGKLGMKKEAKEALVKYRKSWRWPFWIAAAVYLYPFEDGEILEHLADGFNAAGLAERPPSRYLKLNHETKLTGPEIKDLMFGHTIRGRGFWSGLAWTQKRTIVGKVSHTGQSIYTGLSDAKEEGKSWIEGDRLCDHWSEVGDEITICVMIFRDSDRTKNDYYMMTDQGPHPFQVSN